jgi:hypothetical protein
MSWIFRSGAGPDPQRFYDQYGMEGDKPFTNDYVAIASAYGARCKTRWTPTDDQIETACAFIENHEGEPVEERRGIKNALGYLEAEFSRELGMKDRKSLDWRGGGDVTQMDCVDEAWNATVLCQWLDTYKTEFTYHTVIEPMCKTPLFRWNHYAAILRDTNGKLWAIDGGVRRGGQPPAIYDADNWYE